MPKSPTICLHSASEHDADMLYATNGFVVGDPIFWFRKGARTYLLVSTLEVGRAIDGDAARHVIDVTVERRRLERRTGRSHSLAEVYADFLTRKGVSSVTVPSRFPVGTANAFAGAGIDVAVVGVSIFPERVVKTPEEVDHIRRAQAANEVALEAALDLLRGSRRRKGFLYHDGEKLTAERVKSVIRVTLMQLGYAAKDPIVAIGDQCVNPHDTGSGPIPPDTSIILDIFPRCMTSGYWADMTRTVVRGKASKELRAIYDAVHAGQQYGIDHIHGGVATQPVHRGIQDVFTARGFRTGKVNGRMQGYIHGTGHGVGLDIHEAPSFGERPDSLPTGAVVTVEPGLYYEKVGGVRLEDMVLVQDDGCENLTQAEKVLEL